MTRSTSSTNMTRADAGPPSGCGGVRLSLQFILPRKTITRSSNRWCARSKTIMMTRGIPLEGLWLQKAAAAFWPKTSPHEQRWVDEIVAERRKNGRGRRRQEGHARRHDDRASTAPTGEQLDDGQTSATRSIRS